MPDRAWIHPGSVWSVLYRPIASVEPSAYTCPDCDAPVRRPRVRSCSRRSTAALSVSVSVSASVSASVTATAAAAGRRPSRRRSRRGRPSRSCPGRGSRRSAHCCRIDRQPGPGRRAFRVPHTGDPVDLDHRPIAGVVVLDTRVRGQAPGRCRRGADAPHVGPLVTQLGRVGNHDGVVVGAMPDRHPRIRPGISGESSADRVPPLSR